MMQKRKEDIENVLRNKADTLMKDRDVSIVMLFIHTTIRQYGNCNNLRLKKKHNNAYK